MEEWLTSDPCFWRTLSTSNTVFGLEDQPAGQQMACDNKGVWPMHLSRLTIDPQYAIAVCLPLAISYQDVRIIRAAAAGACVWLLGPYKLANCNQHRDTLFMQHARKPTTFHVAVASRNWPFRWEFVIEKPPSRSRHSFQ